MKLPKSHNNQKKGVSWVRFFEEDRENQSEKEWLYQLRSNVKILMSVS